MSTSQHTPGKWSVSGCTVYAEDGRPVSCSFWEQLSEPGLGFGENFERYCEESERDYDEACANARLMAAAWLLPEVVEVLGPLADLACQVKLDKAERVLVKQAKQILARLTDAEVAP